MGSKDTLTKSNWVDDVASENRIPDRSVVIDGDKKHITEYKFVGQKLKKITKSYRIEMKKYTPVMIRRDNLKKFGDATADGPGTNEKTTMIGDEVISEFVSNKEDMSRQEDEDRLKMLTDKKGVVKCRNCGGEHWTAACPYPPIDKSNLLDKQKQMNGSANEAAKLANANSATGGASGGSNKYVPPSLRDASGKRATDGSVGGSGMSMMQKRDDTTAIRISNLSESTTESDLDSLVRPFGDVFKIYLSKNHTTGLCKGYAYVHYKRRECAAAAITALHGYGYDHLILDVDWSKPQQS